jgi:hypothetical protein
VWRHLWLVPAVLSFGEGQFLELIWSDDDNRVLVFTQSSSYIKQEK